MPILNNQNQTNDSYCLLTPSVELYDAVGLCMIFCRLHSNLYVSSMKFVLVVVRWDICILESILAVTPSFTHQLNWHEPTFDKCTCL